MSMPNESSLSQLLEAALELLSISKTRSDLVPSYIYAEEQILTASHYDSKFHELRSSHAHKATRQVLELLIQKNQHTCAEFERMMLEQIELAKNEKIRKYVVAFPLAFRFPASATIRKFDSVDGNPVRIEDFQSFDSTLLHLESDPARRFLAGLGGDIKDSEWLTILRESRIVIAESYARDPKFAFNDASKIVKGWTEILCYSQATIFRSPPWPFTAMKLPEFGIIFQDDSIVQFGKGGYPIPNDPYQSITDLPRFYDVKDKIGKLPDLKVKQIILNAVSTYAEAVTDDDMSYSFLKLWIGLESMVKLRQKLSDEKVASRMKNMFYIESTKPTNFDSQVDEVLNKRNLILHQGQFDVVQLPDAVFAKQLYEMIIIQLMKFCNNSLDVDWIEEYYEHAATRPDVLLEKKAAIEFLIKQKEANLA